LCQCSECGAARLDPRPSDDELAGLYLDYYTHEPSQPEGGAPGGLAGIRRRLRNGYVNARFDACTQPALNAVAARALVWLLARTRAVTDRTFRHLRVDGRLLDVGCGEGSFLDLAGRAGWQATGIDTDPEAVAAAQRAGVDARCETLAEHAAGGSHYDAVTISHVLEHVPDPVALLEDAYVALRPGGTVWIATPNLLGAGHRHYGAQWWPLDAPRHLVVFSPASLRRAVEGAGFIDVRPRDTAGFTRHDFAMSEQRGDPRTPPLGVRLRAAFAERLGLLRRAAADEIVVVARRPDAPGWEQ
jgi:2-polyprenyl-3-methyl-5-hydroxy-6-metoxy-1,4-benzoquinol methylase